MAPITFTLLATIIGLLAFLALRLWQRMKVPIVQERQWIGHGFDPGLVTNRIKTLRSDYVSAVRAHSRPPGYHEEFMARTRRLIVDLGFFRNRRAASMGATLTSAVATRDFPD